jgi:YegS/Rv2252/BmrU family lipid kinase
MPGRDRVATVTEAIRKVLAEEVGIFEIKVTRGKGGAELYSRDAVTRGFDAVFACGGDGTVNEVATPLVDTSTALGIIPFGSGNGLARTLNIPEDPPEAIALLKRFRVRAIDVGVVCDRYFFGTAGFGFDAHLSKKYNEGALASRVRGIMPYFPLAIKEFYRYEREPVVVKIGNNSIRVVPFLLTIANIERYGGDAIIAPGALPDDGQLDLCIVPEIGIADTYALATKLLNGGIESVKGFRHVRAESFEIDRDKATLVHVDGEPFEWQGNIRVKVLHRKLKVLV